ncbi:MAG TPA: leucyl/phenylalanyl-tRNA--protein transferase [Acidimicrobiales bacterium]
MPVDPPPSPWVFPPADSADEHGLVGVGADLEPGTILAAYRSGLFPMPLRRRGPIGWWSPDPRGVLELDDLKVSRSLRQACKRFEIRIDTAFDDVIAGCADPRRPNGWIDPRIIEAYRRLFRMGWVHTVEAWDSQGRLAGGLYGVSIGAFFAGESMFHRARDASKVALVALVDLLRSGPDADVALLDVQWCTDHLASLGASELARPVYLRRLAAALEGADPWHVDRAVSPTHARSVPNATT